MSYGNYGQNPYQQSPAAEGGYGSYGSYGGSQPQQQSYGQPQNNQYEMSPYPPAPQGPQTYTLQEFLDRVQHVRSEITALAGDVEQVAALHQRALGAVDSAAARELDARIEATQVRNTAIRDQMRALANDAGRTRDGSATTKKTQLESLRARFRDELQNFQRVEADYQRRYRDQISRQYRVANPNATEEEVAQAAEMDWGNDGVFQQALLTNRTGHANSVLGAVRARHNELQRIEQTVAELAQLYQDLDSLVVIHEDQIVAVENNAQQTVDHMEAGNAEVDKGIKSARRARRNKWWCLLVVVLIILIAIGVGVGVWYANHPNRQA